MSFLVRWVPYKFSRKKTACTALGCFQRAIPLPAELNHDRAEASFEKGKLNIRFPKVPRGEEKGKKIPITG